MEVLLCIKCSMSPIKKFKLLSAQKLSWSFCRQSEASLVRGGAKGDGQERSCIPTNHGMAIRVEMPCRMIMRESRLAGRLEQCLESYMEVEMRVAENCLKSAMKIWEAGKGQRAWGRLSGVQVVKLDV